MVSDPEGDEWIRSGSQRPHSCRTACTRESRVGDSPENQADLTNGDDDHDLDSCIKLNPNDCAFNG